MVEEILLARHAEAQDKLIARRQGLPDKLRPLTEKGKETQKEVLYFLKPWLKNIELLIHSPLLRSQQTARLILKAKKIPQTLEFKWMGPEDDAQKLMKMIKTLKNKKLVIVGHEPHLSKLRRLLMEDSGAAEIKLKKSSLCLLKRISTERKFTLCGLFNP